MSESDNPEGAISRKDLKRLALLFDAFENAFDPLSSEAKLAEADFDDGVKELFDQQVLGKFPSLSFSQFKIQVRIRCRKLLKADI